MSEHKNIMGAGSIRIDPSGDISSTDLANAINELDAEKASMADLAGAGGGAGIDRRTTIERTLEFESVSSRYYLQGTGGKNVTDGGLELLCQGPAMPEDSVIGVQTSLGGMLQPEEIVVYAAFFNFPATGDKAIVGMSTGGETSVADMQLYGFVGLRWDDGV